MTAHRTVLASALTAGVVAATGFGGVDLSPATTPTPGGHIDSGAVLAAPAIRPANASQPLVATASPTPNALYAGAIETAPATGPIEPNRAPDVRTAVDSENGASAFIQPFQGLGVGKTERVSFTRGDDAASGLDRAEKSP